MTNGHGNVASCSKCHERAASEAVTVVYRVQSRGVNPRTLEADSESRHGTTLFVCERCSNSFQRRQLWLAVAMGLLFAGYGVFNLRDTALAPWVVALLVLAGFIPLAVVLATRERRRSGLIRKVLFAACRSELARKHSVKKESLVLIEPSGGERAA